MPHELPAARTDWVKTPELMEHLDIRSAVTITKYIRDGMPAHKIGKGYRFDLTEVDEWIRSRCTTPAPGKSA